MSKKFNWMPILRTGTFTDKNNQTVKIDATDLDKVVSATDLTAEPQFVIEHPSFDKLGFGTIEKLKRVGDYLLALPKTVEDKFKDIVNSGKLPGRSVTLDKKTFSLKNISFLPPSVPPAVSGLGAYSFSEGENDTLLYSLSLPGVESHFADLEEDKIEFASYEVSRYPFRSIQTLISNIRDFFIEKFGLEKTNQIIPKYYLDEIGNPPRIWEKPEQSSSLSSSFQTNINEDNKMIDLSKIELSKITDPNVRAIVEALMTEVQSLDTKFKAKDVELQAATSKLTTAERTQLRNEVLQFCAGDDVKFKITPAVKEKVINFLMAQKEVAKNGVIEFSTPGENGTSTEVKLNAYDFAKEIIKMLPDVIELSEFATKANAGEQKGLTDYQKTAAEMAKFVN